MILKFAMMYDDVKRPNRANPSDAGLDLFLYSPDKEIKILPGESVLLETGLKFEIPHNMMMQIMNRSSMASKRQLLVGASVVDSGFNGQVMINLHNVGRETQTLVHHDKIAQAVVMPIFTPRFSLEPADLLYQDDITISNRGDGGFGSTGR